MKYYGLLIYFSLIFLLIKIDISAITIDSIKLDIRVRIGERVGKRVEITNNSKESVEYKIEIDGDKNIRVTPKKFILEAGKKKVLNISVIGKEGLGEKEFYLIIIERKLSEGSGVSTNYRYRIKQKYTVL